MIEEQEIEDEMDTSLIDEGLEQEAMERRVQERLNAIAPSTAEDDDYQQSITHKIIEDSNREILEVQTVVAGEINTASPVTPPNRGLEEGLPVDSDLLSPQLTRLQLEPSEEIINPSSPVLRQQVRVNQQHADKRTRRQYGKQRQITTFEIGDQVSVAVPALDRATTDDKRMFGRVINVKEEYDSYQIVTKYGVLNRWYPISELNPLPKHIDIGIPNPPPTNPVSLHACAAQESTTEKVAVHCGCRDQRTWCSTRRCACYKANAKCSIACHGGKDQDNMPECPNISSMTMRTQRGHRTRDQEVGNKEAKRQRRNTAGRWAASKGSNLVDGKGNAGSRASKKGGSK